MRRTIFLVSLNCLSNWFTWYTLTPAPAAIRAFREPFRISGCSRSRLVIELIMTVISSRACSLTWPSRIALSPPGRALTSFWMPPILLTCCFISKKSFKVKLPRAMRSASSSSISSAFNFEAVSIMLTTSPMPRIRFAIRSGWNSSKESGFSPDDMKEIGFPVTCLIESAPPPRASPSILDIMTPSKSTRSAKAFATFTASWPVIASTTM